VTLMVKCCKRTFDQGSRLPATVAVCWQQWCDEKAKKRQPNWHRSRICSQGAKLWKVL